MFCAREDVVQDGHRRVRPHRAVEIGGLPIALVFLEEGDGDALGGLVVEVHARQSPEVDEVFVHIGEGDVVFAIQREIGGADPGHDHVVGHVQNEFAGLAVVGKHRADAQQVLAGGEHLVGRLDAAVGQAVAAAGVDVEARRQRVIRVGRKYHRRRRCQQHRRQNGQPQQAWIANAANHN
jgi:hypothetical protein